MAALHPEEEKLNKVRVRQILIRFWSGYLAQCSLTHRKVVRRLADLKTIMWERGIMR